jgi:hypothetical protein
VATHGPDRLPAFEALDRLALVEMRPPTSPAGVMGPFYRLLRNGADTPLHYQITEAVLHRQGQGTNALILTGLVDEDRFPHGEIDGPIGSIALARALTLLGWEVTILVDVEAHAPVRAVLDLADVSGVTLLAGDCADQQAARQFGGGFSLVFAVEKLGRNAMGVRHLVWGTPCDKGDPYSDDYVLGASAAGALTIAIGDNGNEIGFGKLPREAGAITPRGLRCECPCGEGIFSTTPCDHLLPASVSNLGCYTLVAALALASKRPELALSGEQVRSWTEAGLEAGLRSGGVDDPHFKGDDGIPTRYVAAHAELIAGVVHQGLLGDAWLATTAP